MNMNAVGIDVSKRKSTVTILRPGGKVIVKPFDVPHLLCKFNYSSINYRSTDLSFALTTFNDLILSTIR